MKKIVGVCLLFCFSILLTGCENESSQDNSSPSSSISSNSTDNGKFKLKQSKDKNTAYVKNYVGRNASTAGTERLSGNIMDSYGEGNLTLVFISENGEAVTEENRKDYVITDQNPEPNTEIKYTFETTDSGEQTTLVDTQSLEEIELYVKKVNTDQSSE
ncbi:hypothetical protein NRIC_12310 [Enterococcus florum]|uniref:Lipoprotein n=1 Tax=Enterococcus florum TaxID=2480627 RepID=A0A4P5P6G2_9ENTE|nr:hypothetical protein [Enterococcus florum]GCF93340.1 hypothetical protein NRIC_12310 [Enterococcus florum]